MRVLLADDHTITRQGTQKLLATEADVEIVAEAADGAETVALAEELQPDIVLLDISMPKLNGVQVVEVLRRTAPATRVVVLTGYDNEQYGPALLRLGVRGYLPKSASARELIDVLRAVHRGETYYRSAVASLLDLGGDDKPTQREMEVLRLVAEGRRNREVAQAISTSERTVQFHLSNLFIKFGVSSRTEMVHHARKKGWIA
jgi:DNA-binding NarL/FixJ family response regulator